MEEDKLLEALNKKYGNDVIFHMSSRQSIVGISALPSGSLSLDHATGVGGYPRGRIIEIFGPEAGGKTLLSLSAIAQTQRSGGKCAFIDVEHALSLEFAKLSGVNTDELVYSQPDKGDVALQVMEDLIRSDIYDIVCLDSVAALVTEEELKKGYGDHAIARTAILMAEALRKMTAIISTTKTVAIFINQLRDKPMVLFGSPEYTPGGRALKFYSSLRIDVRKKTQDIDEAGKRIGHTIVCKIVKNKVAPPFTTCTIRLDYKYGVDQIYDVIECGKVLNIIKQSSSYYYYKEATFNGEEKLRIALEENEHALLKQLCIDIKETIEKENA